MTSLLVASTRRPVLTLIVAGIITLLAIVSILRLRPETSLDAMLDPHDPATAAMGRVLRQFPVAEEMLVLVSTPDDRPVDRAALLEFAERLTTRLATDASDVVHAVRFRPSEQARQFVERVIAPAGLYYLNDEGLAEARRRLTPESMAEQLRRNEAMLAAPGPAAGGLAKGILQDPLRLHELLVAQLQQLPQFGASDAFFSGSGRDLLIRIEGKKPPSDLAFSDTLTQRVSAITAALNEDRLTVRITGAYAIAAYNAGMIRRDAINDSASSVAALGLLFFVLYRRPIWVFLAAFTPIAIGITCGFGVYALFRDTITPLAAVIGGAMGGIGIDYSTHMLAHYRTGRSPAELATRLAVPLLAACATSVIGFAVIGWSPVQLLRDFAIVGSLSLIFAFLAALTVLPAMLALRRTDASPRFAIARREWQRPGLVLAICLGALVPIGVVALGVDLSQQDPELHNLHPQPNPPLDAQAEIGRRMSLNAGAMLVHVRADSAAQLLERCRDVQARLASPQAVAGGVISSFGPAALLPDPAITGARRAAFSDADVQRVVSDFDAALAQSSFDANVYAPYRSYLAKLLRPGPPPGIADLRSFPELSDTVLPRNAASNDAIIHLAFAHPLDTRSDIDKAMTTLNHLLADVPGATLTGMSVISQQTLTAVRRDLPRVAMLAGVCVAAYLVVHYRSLLLAALAIVPTLVSLIVLLAVMRITGTTLNMVNLVMVPLLLGINIDFGIFAADTLRDPEERTLGEQFTSSIRALTTCAITAVLGFGSLIFVSIPAVRSLGLLVCAGVIGCALGAALVLWPIVILIAWRRGVR
ncbi:MAG: MMPL family transporter [Burkholderiales bacterium]|nr:MMPL family transporter [Phycisphaerae bacterium]